MLQVKEFPQTMAHMEIDRSDMKMPGIRTVPGAGGMGRQNQNLLYLSGSGPDL